MTERLHFWLISHDPETGKPHLIYGGTSEDEARMKGIDWLQGIDFKIVPLRTRNLATASAQVRGKRLDAGQGLHRASQRQGHEKTVRRMLRRRQVNGD